MNLKAIDIRESTQADLVDVLRIEKLAFGSDSEAELVDNLVKDPTAQPVLSLLAFYRREAVGHILFTKAVVDNPKSNSTVYILAPLAVMPECQQQGVGGALIREGLKRLKAWNVDFVFVLGHKAYYPKFGFIPDAARFGFPVPWPIPEKDADAWMFQNLSPEKTVGFQGRILCAEAMNKPEYWRE